MNETLPRFHRALLALSLFLPFVPASAQQGDPVPEPPSLETVATIVRGKQESPHPRLFVSPEDLAQLSELLGQDGLKRQVATAVIQEAERELDEAPVTRTLQGRRLLGQSRRCLERVLTWATAYHLTGREVFARRAEEEMLAAAAFTDWNPSHFLDVAEMTLALAVGYDWLFDQLSEESRSTIRQAIVDKSLRLPFETGHRGWVTSRNNWGQVCHGGLTAGALAVLEDEPELAARTVHNALANIHFSMEAYRPKGSYPEGPGYWSYGTTYNVILIAVLQSALGDDFGLAFFPGFDQTGQYLPLVTGPSGWTFNYSDGGPGRKAEPAVFWFADHFDRPDWLRDEFDLIRAGRIGGRFQSLLLLWMDPSMEGAPNRMPLHWSGGGEVPIVIHRSSWTDPDRIFIGFKGGSPSANHGNMDIGSFVLDAEGIRWAEDLGAEGYHGIESRGMNLWDRSQDSDRWTIFRQMNQGHNTLVIDDKLQRAKGFGSVVRFSADPVFPHSVMDLTSVYAGQAETVLRGIGLVSSKQVLIQDELTGLRPGSNVRWGMITSASVESIGPDQIRLTQAGRTLILRIVSPPGAAWTTIETSRPRHEWDSPNEGTVMAAFEIEAGLDGWLRLAVAAREEGHSTSLKPLQPLESWR